MQPPSHPAVPRSAWIIAILVLATVIAALVHAGFTPDYWMLRQLQGAPAPYPIGSVATFSLMAAIELAVGVAIVRPWRFHRLWLRLLIGLAVMLAWTLPWAMAAMHQSPVRGIHLLWLLALDLLMLLALLVVVVISACPPLRRWLQGR